MFARLILLLLLAMATPATWAEIYKCKTPSGKSVFSDSPCESGAAFEKIRPSESGSSPELARQDLARQQKWISNRAAEHAAFDRALRQQQAIVASSPAIAPAPAAPRTRARTPRGGTSATAAASEQYFMTGGGVMNKPPGSSFAYDNNGNSYHKPEGSAFSYGKGGKTCFHFGAFADCR